MILVIDNYDSFTYNLVQYLGVIGEHPHVVRNDAIDLEGVIALAPSGILLSPGPCTPAQSGVCRPIVQEALHGERLAGVPIFGVCLGHQTLADVAGGIVTRACRIRHGKTSPVRHDGRGLFAGMPNPFRAVRYHSLAIEAESLPADFEVTATSEDDGEIMGVRHRSLPLEGVQFHPESILTEDGLRILRNFVEWTRGRRPSE